jgi:hypothetical protein
VLAGADGLAGAAHLALHADDGAALRVCDNQADGWGVRATVHDATGGGDALLTGTDPAYADGCGTFTAPAGTAASGSATVQVCLYQGEAERDCRELTVG